MRLEPPKFCILLNTLGETVSYFHLKEHLLSREMQSAHTRISPCFFPPVALTGAFWSDREFVFLGSKLGNLFVIQPPGNNRRLSCTYR